MRKTIINLLLLLLGLCILALMVFWAGPVKIWSASKKANAVFMVSGLLIFVFYLFMRSLRWYVMLKATKDDIKLKELIPVYFLNFMISNITPGRSGEVAAPFLMKRHVGSSTGMGFSVVLVDRILDILFIVGMAILGFIYYILSTDLPQSINVAFYIAIAVLMAMAGIMIMATLWQKGASAFLIAFTNLFFRKRQKQLLEGLNSFYDGLKIVGKVMPTLIAYAILSWVLLGISYFLRIRAVLYSPLLPIMSCWIISMCIGMASFIPSGLGSSQASFAYLLSLIAGDFAHATAAALVAKFVALIVIFALGLGSLLLIRRKLT
ncbi:TPA: flippase-like domain-containing protein [Candidatus Poribacteria bacterium]|nr:flippase-like domain-containing protein [Candidatus Poribacteria bacterium]